jgi:arylsulfatase
MSARRPNIVLIMTDDMGWSDVGCYGGEIPTPNIDALARDGVRMTNFYNTARCSPSRASLLTGLHPHQTGIGELTTADGPGGYPGSLNQRCATLAETLKAVGYRTHMTGKWHLCSDADTPNESWPTRRGFDRYWGTIAGAGSYFAPTTLHDGETPVPIEDLPPDFYYTDAIGEHAAAAIADDAAGGQPFFGYVAFTAAHWPLHARDTDIARMRGRYDEGWDVLRARRHDRQIATGMCQPDATVHDRDPDVRSWEDTDQKTWEAARMEVYAAQVHAMDRAVGTILTALTTAGVRDDTIVVYLHDNGGCAEEMPFEQAAAEAFRQRRYIVPPSAPDGTKIKMGNDPSIHPGTADTYTSYGQAWANVSNTPFRLYKRWVHEGGTATPLIASWPAGELRRDAVLPGPHQLTDIVPTLMDAVAAPAPDAGLPPLAGVSMLAHWRGGPATAHPLFWEHIGNAAMRDGNWKLVREYEQDWELYDLSTDRSEQHDVAGRHPDRVAAMTTAWQQWADRVGVLNREDVLTARRTHGRFHGG